MANGRRIELSINNLLLKGSILRHNDWVIGMVVFTGENTKYQVPRPKTKPNVLRVELQSLFLMLAGLIVLVAFAMAISRYVFIYTHRHTMRYMIPLEQDPKNKYKPLLIPFAEFDLELDSARFKQFLEGWIYYMLTMAEIIPVLLPSLIWLLETYFNKLVLSDNVLNPKDGARTACQPVELENLGKLGMLMVEPAALSSGKMLLTNLFVDGEIIEVKDPNHEKQPELSSAIKKKPYVKD